MLARLFGNYRLHMAGITQDKQKCIIFIVIVQGRKNFSQMKKKSKNKQRIE